MWELAAEDTAPLNLDIDELSFQSLRDQKIINLLFRRTKRKAVSGRELQVNVEETRLGEQRLQRLAIRSVIQIASHDEEFFIQIMFINQVCNTFSLRLAALIALRIARRRTL